ncbi:glycoside hydrolase family 3 C-terminal domain-containing protein [uncultured Sphaerochaeta sp.]|uniref:glycoside hydrolase family 3 C-terminal domain-containing protein n=1 Tax=uncultured Sphaerochaeta sp. TaxID=886478 RepID=UPI002A0A14E4|nr:glycoside hydrolase family 3 C-terminal domain-containing protein [uncultured Sphaerochaeta sp.]
MQHCSIEESQIREKAEVLVSRMSLLEVFSQLLHSAPAIPHLHIPAYNWWNEGLHGAARSGTATVFPQVIGLASIFDPSLMKQIGSVVATEQRAKYNAFSRLGDRGIYKGLSVWSPNINIFRDPRWGRGQETFGEDPYLTGVLGKGYIQGLQGDDPYFLKVAACIKHFVAHSGPEAGRHSFNALVSAKDLAETYLPAFKVCVEEARVNGVMGAYSCVNGDPCCGMPMIQTLLRDTWNFSGMFISDCWAIRDFHQGHRVTKNLVESVAQAVNAGCDLNCGCEYGALESAYKQGLILESTAREECVRVMMTRLQLGLFAAETPYDDIAFDSVDCDEHADLCLAVAEKSLVLLKNEDDFLPLSPHACLRFSVIGPNADSRKVLWGNYHGTSSRNVTILEGIRSLVGEPSRVRYSEGSALDKSNVERLGEMNDRLSEAVTLMQMSDVGIVCLGLDESIEGEMHDDGNGGIAGDKRNLLLPECQRNLLKAVDAVGKPIVLILLSGGALDPEMERFGNIKAVVQGWYPGQSGGMAIARLIFGFCNPSGKLPVTFYKANANLPDFSDYSMENRTYRYFLEEPIYPFAYGLSYTRYEYSDLVIESQAGVGLQISFAINNVGKVGGEEVAFAWCHTPDKDAPIHPVLCGFVRVFISAGETTFAKIHIPYDRFSVVSDDGTIRSVSGPWDLWVGGHQPNELGNFLSGTKTIYKHCNNIHEL